MEKSTTLHGVEQRIAKGDWRTEKTIDNIFQSLHNDGYLVTELEGFGDDMLLYKITTDDRHNTITCSFRRLRDMWVVEKFEYSKGVEK